MRARGLSMCDHTGSEARLNGFEAAYEKLRELAYRYLGRAGNGHTLQPTAVVHEAFLRLNPKLASERLDQNTIIGFAARTMRLVLVDHARRRRARKRGGGMTRQPLDSVFPTYEDRAISLLALDEAMGRLAGVDPRLARIVELRFFGGLSHSDTAVALGISATTVRREWKLAKLWLQKALREST